MDQHEPIILLKQILMKISNTRLNHNLFSFRDETCDKHSVYNWILKRQHNTASTKHVWCFSVIFSQPSHKWMKTKMKMTTHSHFVLIKFHMFMPCKMAGIRTAFLPSEATIIRTTYLDMPKNFVFPQAEEEEGETVQ